MFTGEVEGTPDFETVPVVHDEGEDGELRTGGM